MVAVASAGSRGADEQSATSDCGRLVLIIGSEDNSTSPHTHDYYDYLLGLGADVQILAFDGGHELPAQQLRIVLGQLFEEAADD